MFLLRHRPLRPTSPLPSFMAAALPKDVELKKVLRWEIENFSERKDVMTSDPFSSGGCKWCVTVYPKGCDGRDDLSLFLQDANTKSLRPGWKRRASFCFVLLNQSGKELYRSPDQDVCSSFCAEVPGWGFRTELTLTKLQEKGFLEKNKLTIQVYLKVVEVVHQGKSTENDVLDYNGVQILASQVASVGKFFIENPDYEGDFKRTNEKVAYLKRLIGLILTLSKSPQSLSLTELRNAQNELTELTEAGFKLDWLKSKLEEISLERKKALSDGSWVQQLEERVEKVELALSDLKVELDEEKIKSAAAQVSSFAVRKKILPDHGEPQLTVILCLAPGHNNDHLNDMPPDVQKLVDPYELSPFITQVCKYAAVSKEEWEEQCKIWPTSFHPPTYNIDGIGGFSEEETQSICKFMRLAVDLVINQLVNAAVIVDPSVRRIIASETDQVYPHCDMTSTETMPIKEIVESSHCQSIDRVTNASSEICLNGILEKLNGSLSTVACLNPWQWSLQPHDSQECSQWHPLRHASIVAIKSSSARDRYLFPNSSESLGEDQSQPSNIDSPAKKQKTSSHSPDVQNECREEALRDLSMERPYLCTGYDIFLLWEPCTMCAMALVHQRIKRIFYAFPNPTAGGLGSVHRLQGEKSLNHHYAVLRVLLPGHAHNALDSV